MSSRGGSRRGPTPQVDARHLQDVLLAHVKQIGVGKALDVGQYMSMNTSEAVNGPELAKQKELIKALFKVDTGMMFKYIDLKDCLSKCLREYPDIKMRYGEDKRPVLHEHLASSMLTMAAHTRRLKDDVRFQQALKKCSQFEAQELTEIRGWVMEADPVLPLKSSTSKESFTHVALPPTPKTPPLSESMVDNQSEMNQEAEASSPIPCRKKTIKAIMKRGGAAEKISSQKKPAASKETASTKKPAGKASYVLMYYKSGKGAWAIRQSGGSQLFQVVVGEKNKEEVRQRCLQAIEKLERGQPVEDVKEWARK